MTLDEYLQATKTSRKDFGGRVGVSAETVRLWILGQRAPRRQKIDRIHQVTGGLVTANDLFPLQEQGRAA